MLIVEPVKIKRRLNQIRRVVLGRQCVGLNDQLPAISVLGKNILRDVGGGRGYGKQRQQRKKRNDPFHTLHHRPLQKAITSAESASRTPARISLIFMLHFLR